VCNPVTATLGCDRAAAAVLIFLSAFEEGLTFALSAAKRATILPFLKRGRRMVAQVRREVSTTWLRMVALLNLP
jgi:hypothetical protein